MAPLAVPSGRVKGFGFEDTVGEEVPFAAAAAVDVKRFAYFEIAAAAVWAVEDDPVVVEEDDN
jgi:hypothetical protein